MRQDAIRHITGTTRPATRMLTGPAERGWARDPRSGGAVGHGTAERGWGW
jgi:hypothetical protein